MTGAEQGFLLLTSHLGDPARRPLSIAQFRELALRAGKMGKPLAQRELTEKDLRMLGCDAAFSTRIQELLSQQEQLRWYLDKGRKKGCIPITRISDGYPHRLRKCLGLNAPGVLWMKGDRDILRLPAIALVGSRDLNDANREFAWEVGKQAAKQGYVLISGHARGADRQAQDSCLEHGGKVISVVSDQLEKHCEHGNVLYLSEDGFDLPFSAERALKRNRVIHSLSPKTFVAQCGYGKGGTWNGTKNNLRFGWSTVFCFDDGGETCQELVRMGAYPVTVEDLWDISGLNDNTMSLFK